MQIRRCLLQVSTITNHHPEMRVILLHSSGSPKLANHTKFPYPLGILGSTQPLVDLFCSHLCTKAAGKTFSIQCDRDQLYFSTIMKDFIASVDKTVGVDYLSASAFTLTRYPLHEILSSRVCIMFVFAPLEHTKQIMCLVNHVNIGYPKYQWVLVSHWVEDFTNEDITFKYTNKEYKCSLKNLQALEGTFFVNYQMSTTAVH